MTTKASNVRQLPNAGGENAPVALDAEQSVLGAILIKPSVMDSLTENLSADDFYHPVHANIYQAMLALYHQDKPLDSVTVCAVLRDQGKLDEVGGPVFISTLPDRIGVASNAGYYAKLVREKALARRLLQRAQEIAHACQQPYESITDLMDYAESRIYDLLETKSRDTARFFDELIPSEVVNLETTFYEKREAGILTGYYDLDKLLGGLRPGEMVILAARPGQGKTALAVNIAHQVAKQGKTVGLFSLEMTESQLTRRFFASVGHIDGERLRRVMLTQSEWAKLADVAGELKSLPIQIDAGVGLSVLDIRARARRLKYRQGLDLLIVDYLQLIRPHKGRTREQEVTAISQALKNLSKELNIPVLALCQLNREIEKRDSKRPKLSDLRESGSLEQDADVVVFISRNETIADVEVAKQRNGRTGRFQLLFAEQFIKFDNFAKEDR